jgi:hypothetical protein
LIRAAVLALMLAGPAGAEVKLAPGTGLCLSAWLKFSELVSTFGEVTEAGVTQEGDWCVVDAPVLDMAGQYVPDWHMDRLRFRGSALGWIVDGSTLPEGLEVAVEGLRLVVQTGNAQMDWLLAAQSRPSAIQADLSLAWDPAARELRLEGLSLDFPGENLVQVSGTATGVDLSSTGAMQMSATSFALTEFDARITMHGLFEWYALMALGPTVLPTDGDIEAGAEELRAQMTAAVRDIPDAMVPQASKAALGAWIGELPNPSGDLTLSLRAKPGIGPGRLAGYAVTGVPATMADAAPLFQGMTLDVDWTHADAP